MERRNKTPKRSAVISSSSIFWVEEDSDGSKCLRCEQVIQGSMFYPVIELAERKIEETTYNNIDIKLCRPCYEIKVANQ